MLWVGVGYEIGWTIFTDCTHPLTLCRCGCHGRSSARWTPAAAWGWTCSLTSCSRWGPDVRVLIMIHHTNRLALVPPPLTSSLLPVCCCLVLLLLLLLLGHFRKLPVAALTGDLLRRISFHWLLFYPVANDNAALSRTAVVGGLKRGPPQKFEFTNTYYHTWGCLCTASLNFIFIIMLVFTHSCYWWY